MRPKPENTVRMAQNEGANELCDGKNTDFMTSQFAIMVIFGSLSWIVARHSLPPITTILHHQRMPLPSPMERLSPTMFVRRARTLGDSQEFRIRATYKCLDIRPRTECMSVHEY